MRWTMLAAAMLFSGPTAAQPKPDQPAIKLWRIDCGYLDENRQKPWPWQQVATPCPCFLIAHGDRYMLWDAGISARALTMNNPRYKLERTISDQLKEIGVKPEQVEFVGISHYHGDHTGQATAFPSAHLLIGAGDLAAMRSPTPPPGVAPTHLRPWLADGASFTALAEDHDVFGDGRVTILMTPGHTPGHSALVVRLAGGTVMLTGDLWLSHAEALKDDMADFNTSRAETLASRQRFSRLAWHHDATVVVQHELADINLLPTFPQAAS